jgi:L-histidine N-alpha-methyltransferase
MSTAKTGSPAASASSADAERARRERIWRRAYAARSSEDLRALYADWARTYDEDHAAIGFIGHEVTADLLARYVSNPDVRPILDAGAGTGAAGRALHARGFRNLTGVDLSAEMLEVARQQGVYRQLFQVDLGEPIDRFPAAQFHAAVLVGVFSYGQAPAHALDEVVRLVETGGLIAFTVRDDFFEADAMGLRSRCRELEERSVLRLLEVGPSLPYLPKKDPDATFHVRVYRVLEADDAIAKDAFREAVGKAAQNADGVLRLDHAFIWNSTASRLYNRYTRRPEYYLTDCEEEILRGYAPQILGDRRTLVELGCGSARKIRPLLEVAVADPRTPVVYEPIDVSEGALESTADEVRALFGDSVDVRPLHGMFDEVLARISGEDGKLVLFFGSSIGNLESVADTVTFLRGLRARLRRSDRLVVGVDLHKDEDELLAAYNAGAENLSFFLNMVRRINDELGADFDLGAFRLGSTYRQEEPSLDGVSSWSVDLRVVSTARQHVYIRELDLEFVMEPGHAVQVGTSRKYRSSDIRKLAELAGFDCSRQWFDRRGSFSLNELRPAEGTGA